MAESTTLPHSTPPRTAVRLAALSRAHIQGGQPAAGMRSSGDAGTGGDARPPVHTRQIGGLTFRVEPPANPAQQRQQQPAAQTHTVGGLTFRVEAPPPAAGPGPAPSGPAAIGLDDVLFGGGGSGPSGTPAAGPGYQHERSRHVLESRKVQLQPGFSQVAWMHKMGGMRPGRARRVAPEELRAHCTAESLWIAYRGVVYDCTRYIPYHPGGLEEILRGAGKDCTEAFDEIHKWVTVDAMLRNCVVGKLGASASAGRQRGSLAAPAAPATSAATAVATTQPPPLDLLRWAPVTLLQRTRLSPTCIQLRFGLHLAPASRRDKASSGSGGGAGSSSAGQQSVAPPSPPSLSSCGGCPGQHLDLRWQGSPSTGPVVREYTPVSPLDQQGSFDIALRVYPAPAGRMGQFLAKLPLGAQVACRGMQGRLFLTPDTCEFATHAAGPLAVQPRVLVLCLAGSGATPGMAILSALVRHHHAAAAAAAAAADAVAAAGAAEESVSAPSLPNPSAGDGDATGDAGVDGASGAAGSGGRDRGDVAPEPVAPRAAAQTATPRKLRVEVLCSSRHWDDTLGRDTLLGLAAQSLATPTCSVRLQFFLCARARARAAADAAGSSNAAADDDDTDDAAAAVRAPNVLVHHQRRVGPRDILDALAPATDTACGGDGDGEGSGGGGGAADAEAVPTLLAWCGTPAYHRMVRTAFAAARRPGLAGFDL